jgi:hypothetical protein
MTSIITTAGEANAGQSRTSQPRLGFTSPTGDDAQIRVRHLADNPDRVPDYQLWGTVFGVLK